MTENHDPYQQDNSAGRHWGHPQFGLSDLMSMTTDPDLPPLETDAQRDQRRADELKRGLDRGWVPNWAVAEYLNQQREDGEQ